MVKIECCITNVCMVYYNKQIFGTQVLNKKLQNQEIFVCNVIPFCEKIAITERINPDLQRNMLPLWMRKYMIEFGNNKLK